jgi:hypothetical protein
MLELFTFYQGASMGYLRTHMIEEMKLRGYSETTINMYTKCIYKLSLYYMKNALSISQSEIRNFFLDLINKQKSPTTLHVAVSNSQRIFALVLSLGF